MAQSGRQLPRKPAQKNRTRPEFRVWSIFLERMWRVWGDLVSDIGTATAGMVWHRRLADKVFGAFDQACDEGDLDIAGTLLGMLDQVLAKPSPIRPDRRMTVVTTIAAHERLWLLRHGAEQLPS